MGEGDTKIYIRNVGKLNWPACSHPNNSAKALGEVKLWRVSDDQYNQGRRGYTTRLRVYMCCAHFFSNFLSICVSFENHDDRLKIQNGNPEKIKYYKKCLIWWTFLKLNKLVKNLCFGTEFSKYELKQLYFNNFFILWF